MKISQPLLTALLFTICTSSTAFSAPAQKKNAPLRKAAPAASKAPANAANNSAFNNYANQMRQKMANSWQYPEGNNHVTLTVQVAQDGSVADLTLTSTPKSSEAEQKANDAFNAAQPLQPLPSGTEAATITAIFDSQADQWNSKANVSVKLDPKKSSPAAKSDDSSGSGAAGTAESK
ncbi:MAG: TonB C-terminal domain-containing protein [Candidatus Obscuribacterales bacterium]|nr:TonB C-terminal domain-containing protein [Candidatus Obscuribacterales bacterium]